MKGKTSKSQATFFTYLTNPEIKGWHSLVLDRGKDKFGNFIILSLTVANPIILPGNSSTGRILIGNKIFVYNDVKICGDLAYHYTESDVSDLRNGMVVNIQRD